MLSANLKHELKEHIWPYSNIPVPGFGWKYRAANAYFMQSKKPEDYLNKQEGNNGNLRRVIDK